MDSYYSQGFSAEELQRLNEQSGNGSGSGLMSMMDTDMMGGSVTAGQQLHDMMDENGKAIRRQSLPMVFGGNDDAMDPSIDPTMRRISMMDFGGTSSGAQFQFDAAAIQASMGGGDAVDKQGQSLSGDTQFPTQMDFDSIPASTAMFQSTLDMDLNTPFNVSGSGADMPIEMNMNMINTDFSSLDLFGTNHFESPGTAKDSTIPLPTTTQPILANQTPTTQLNAIPVSSIDTSLSLIQPGQPSGGQPSISGVELPWTDPADGWPSTMNNRPHMETPYRDVYAPSGFDLMNTLIRVATRVNPQINIGMVDLSCSFVVCDAKAIDNPIIYCSESFERLTGYTRFEIKGQNCRFLQSPDGKIEAGVKRRCCDDDSVLYLKNCLKTCEEAQISLINYRKGGQPFMNLLTMIPILDDSGEVFQFVGFQIDMVESPHAVNSKNPDGTVSINYQRRADLPHYLLSPPETGVMIERGQTIPRDEVSTLLSGLISGENELSKRLLDKALLENSDDIIHVLSLKGLFLYLSPSCRKVLEYDVSELVGTALSSVCHPSDIVSVTRELKDTQSGTSISIVFRILRKRSGYVWFESHGTLHSEQGKGRKCIILVGRERPVYALSKNVIMAAGGIGENEMWTKMSTTGMFLFVSSNVRFLLDRQPDELIGTNIQSLMRPDSKSEFGRVLSLALTGKNTSVRHEMTNRRGQVLQAYTWLYPGDAVEGQKPTFVIAQTRLIRYHRGSASQRSGLSPMLEQQSSTGSVQTITASSLSQGKNTPICAASGQVEEKYRSSTGFAPSQPGFNAMPIGRQDASLASDDNAFDELKTTRSTSWQFELRQMERRNRVLAEEVQSLLAAKKKRKRRRGAGLLQKDCANCHTKNTPEWRRGPSGSRDLCNSCGLRWAKQNGRVSPRASQRTVSNSSSRAASKASTSPPGSRLKNQKQSSIGPTSHPTSLGHTVSSMTSAEKRRSPSESNSEPLASKAVRKENASILSSSIPPRIDEANEPTESS